MTNAQRRTIIVDYPSLQKRLNGWYDVGELRHGRAIADAIPIKLDALLARLGQDYSGPARRWGASLKDYSDRRLLLEEGWSAGPDIDAVVEAFNEKGFRHFVDPGRRKSGSLLMDVMRDFLEDRRPTELVIATANPDVVDIVDLLRPLGVLTGLICVFTKTRTDQIRGVPDGLIDFSDIADALELEIRAGFEIKENAKDALKKILSGANNGRWLSLEGAFDELKGEIRRQRSAATGENEDAVGDTSATGENEDAVGDTSHEAVRALSGLPVDDRGKQRYLEDALEAMNVPYWRPAPKGTGVFDVRALDAIASKADQLAKGGWQVERLQELEAAAKQEGATRENSWLGHGEFEDLLKKVRERDANGAWELPDTAMFGDLYLAPSRATSEEADDEVLRNVARFFNERLNGSNEAVRLSELSQTLPIEHPDISAETGWAGTRSFLELVKLANRRYAGEAWVLYTDVPPGYIGLPRHPRPVEETGKRPFRTTSKPNESSAPSLLRTVMSTFPSDDAEHFLLRAAVLATVLTHMNVVSVVDGRNPITVAASDARDLSKKTTGITGRSPFAFLLQSLIKSERARKIREPYLRLVLAIDEMSGKPGQDAEQLLGTRALLRIVSENFQQHLGEQGFGEGYGKEAQSYLGPDREEEAIKHRNEKFHPKLIEAEYVRFKLTETEPATHESLQRMLTCAAEERRAFLDEALMAADESIEPGDVPAADDLCERVRQQIAESQPANEGLSLLELHQALKSDLPKLRLLDLARFLGRTEPERETPWEIFPSPPSSLNTPPYSRRRSFPYVRLLGVSSPRQVGPQLMGERDWFDRSWRFWISLIEKKIAVSWIEAAHSMIRVERAEED